MAVKLISPFTYVNNDHFGRCSDKCPELVPGEALTLRELYERYNRGQRLSIKQFPTNLYPEEEFGRKVIDETFDNVAPICDDIVDVERFAEETEARKKEYLRRQTQQTPPEPPAPPVSSSPTPEG